MSELFLILYVTFLFFPILSSPVVLWSYIYISSAFCFHCSFIFFCITLFTIFVESGTLFLLFSLFSTSSATILSSYWFYSLSWSSFFGFFLLFVFIRFISDLHIFDVFICSRALFFHVLLCSIVFCSVDLFCASFFTLFYVFVYQYVVVCYSVLLFFCLLCRFIPLRFEFYVQYRRWHSVREARYTSVYLRFWCVTFACFVCSSYVFIGSGNLYLGFST